MEVMDCQALLAVVCMPCHMPAKKPDSPPQTEPATDTAPDHRTDSVEAMDCQALLAMVCMPCHRREKSFTKLEATVAMAPNILATPPMTLRAMSTPKLKNLPTRLARETTKPDSQAPRPRPAWAALVSASCVASTGAIRRANQPQA